MMFVRFIQACFIAVPIVLFGWLIVQELVPSGEFIVSRSVSETSPFIDELLPEVRLKEVGPDADGDIVQSIVDDPVFFFVHPHRGFKTIEADVWFKNDTVPIVELGGLAQKAGQVYDLQPLQNLLIDSSDWFRLETNGITLLQRNKTYESIADFLVDPPPRYEIATYHYQLARPYLIDGYVPSNETRTIDVSLRGFHEFKTYVKDETLWFAISYMDMNRAEGPDPVTIFVSNERGEPVWSTLMPDDGDTGSEAVPSKIKTVELSIPLLAEGVYKVELRAERDIFFRQFVTTQQKIVFLNSVYLGDEIAWHEPAQPATFWTQAKNIAVQTQHAEGVQDVQIGAAVVKIEQPYERYAHKVEADGVVRVVVPVSDAIVDTDGYIAFAPDQFFNPDPIRLRETTNLDGLGVNYVIANYSSPERVGNWFVAHATFDAGVLLLDEGSWKFVFSTPGIAETGARLNIGKIEMVWQRDPFTFEDLKQALLDLL